jgi:hypothetical protein
MLVCLTSDNHQPDIEPCPSIEVSLGVLSAEVSSGVHAGGIAVVHK